jgi:hypothetical protein
MYSSPAISAYNVCPTDSMVSSDAAATSHVFVPEFDVAKTPKLVPELAVKNPWNRM